MNPRYAFPSLLALFAAPLFAQPTLSSGSMSFVPGESYNYQFGDYFTPPLAGETDATWDHSAFTSTTAGSSAFLPPNTGGGLPGATVAESIAGGFYGYYKATASTFEQLGVIGPNFTLNCVSDPILMASYPFTFASTISEGYDCSGTSAGQAFNRDNGIVSIYGASYGTLILPYGTFNNVLLLEYTQHHEDEFVSQPGFVTVYDADLQLFVKPGVKAPLLNNVTSEQVPGGIVQNARLLDASSIGIAEALRHDIGMDLMPNPATDRVEILFGVGAGKRLTIELIDVTGKTVSGTQRTTQVNAVQREILDLCGVASGAYTVRVTDETGAIGAKRLVVH